MRRHLAAASAAAILGASAAVVWAAGGRVSQCPDPVEFLKPSVTLSARERQRVDEGRPLVRILPARGREVAVLGVMSVTFDADRLTAWMRRIELLKSGPQVPAVARFSDPPAMADLASHTLDDQDLKRLRECRPGSCDLKLSADEIARVSRELSAAGRDWMPAAQALFRRVMLDRVTAYRASGLAAVGPWADGHTDSPLAAVSRSLIDRSAYLRQRTPALADYLLRYPAVSLPQSETFLYWSTDKFGGRPVSSATHVVILRPGAAALPEVIVAGRQIFATHYQNGSLGLTMLARGCEAERNYLVYLSRSEVDVIRGLMGWLARSIIESRVENEATGILAGLRERLSKPPGEPLSPKP